MISQSLKCYACRTVFPLDLENLRPYRDSLIQGQRAPRYWLRCPACGRKNVVDLDGDLEVIPGKPSVR
jgi:hypothetical protein